MTAIPFHRHVLAWTVGLSASLLAACGGGGDSAATHPDTLTLTGIVADGPLAGAIACYDLGDDGSCDAADPTSAASDGDGRYSLAISTADAGRHGVVVQVPATAIDKDTNAPVGTAFTLKAPPNATPGATVFFVSPLTTLVVDRVASSGSTVADAAALIQAQLGLTTSPLADFVTTPDPQAARLARVVNQVGLEVAKLATAAGVPPEQTRALVAAATLGNLSTLAAHTSSATGTPAEAATEVAAAVLAERNLSAATVVAQAQVAAKVSAPLVATAPGGPFISVRDFTYTSASSYSYRLFTGDDTQLDADKVFAAHEIRRTLVNGVEQPYNRNVAYWTGNAWEVCERQWQVSKNIAQTATTPQLGTYCGASRSETRIAIESIAGRRMADVVAEIRAFPLADNDGLPTNWGPPPALLGDAVFPAGSSLSTREQATDIGNTEYYILTDKPRVAPAFRQAATLSDLKQMTGNWVDAGAVISGANTVYLEDIAVAQADVNLRPVKRYRAAFHPASDAVRFFACDARVSDNASLNCVALGDGSSAISTRADSRVLRFTGGYPADPTSSLKRQRLFVERSGVVFGGYLGLQHTVHQQRLNTAGWVALRDQLGIPAHSEPAAPVANPPLGFLRTFTYTDAGNYFYRYFEGSGVADAGGTYTGDEIRENVIGGVAQPFNFNSEFWTGTDWYACPNDLVGVLRYTLAPRLSTYCRAFVNTTTAPVTMTLEGRNMADVLRDIRWYPSKDGVFDYANFGPNPDTTPLLQAGTFPAGSALSYQTQVQTREPEQVFLGTENLVRNAPSPTSGAPYDSWPATTSLEQAIAFNPGNYAGGALNGNTTLNVYRYFLPTSPDPAYTTEIGYRVAFDAAGQKARVFRHNRAVGTNFSTNYVAILDTTYTVETVGGRRVLKFAQTPDEVLERSGFARIFVERDGEVRFGQQTRIFPGGQHTLRFNAIAAAALGVQLGLN